MHSLAGPVRTLSVLALFGAVTVSCSGKTSGGGQTASDDGDCYPDNDGITDQQETVMLSVSDTGFSKTVISTQNDSTVTFTLTNTGLKPHGFKVGCTSVLSSYPDLPAGCATTACFPATSTITSLPAGQSMTITFVTPTPDNLVYPFSSADPDDADVPGLDGSTLGWNLM